MRRFALTLTFFFSFLSVSFSEDLLKPDKVLFLPPRFYVGDTIEILCSVTLPDPGNFSEPAALPESDWVVIQKVTVKTEGQRAEIRMRVTPFRPETFELPKIRFGGYVLQGVEIPVASLLEENRSDFAGPKGPLLLPGTRLFILLVVLGIAAAGGGILFLYKLGPRLFAAFFLRRRKYAAMRRFRRTLKQLEAACRDLSSGDFYNRLHEGFRTWFSVFLSEDYRVLTTREIASALGSRKELEDAVSPLLTVLRRGDQARFGNVQIAKDTMLEDVEILRDTASFFQGMDHVHLEKS